MGDSTSPGKLSNSQTTSFEAQGQGGTVTGCYCFFEAHEKSQRILQWHLAQRQNCDKSSLLAQENLGRLAPIPRMSGRVAPTSGCSYCSYITNSHPPAHWPSDAFGRFRQHHASPSLKQMDMGEGVASPSQGCHESRRPSYVGAWGCVAAKRVSFLRIRRRLTGAPQWGH